MCYRQVGIRPFGVAPPTPNALDVSLHLPFQSNPNSQPKRDHNHQNPPQSPSQDDVGNGEVGNGDVGVNGGSGVGEKVGVRGGPGLGGSAGEGAGEGEDPLDSLVVEVRGQDLPLHGAVASQSSGGEWINTFCQCTISMHPINTSFTTYSMNIPNQHSLSTHPIITLHQHTHSKHNNTSN